MARANLNGCSHVLLVEGAHDTEGHLAIVRRVGGVDAAGRDVKVNVTANHLVQFALNRLSSDVVDIRAVDVGAGLVRRRHA